MRPVVLSSSAHRFTRCKAGARRCTRGITPKPYATSASSKTESLSLPERIPPTASYAAQRKHATSADKQTCESSRAGANNSTGKQGYTQGERIDRRRKTVFCTLQPNGSPFTSAYRCAQRKAGVTRFSSGGDTSEPCTASHTAARSERPASAGKQAHKDFRAAAKNGTQTKRCAGQRGFRRQGAAIQTRRHSADAGCADKRPDGKRAALRASPI